MVDKIFINAFEIGIIELTDQLKIVYCNKYACDILEYKQGELNGKDFSALFNKHQFEELEHHMNSQVFDKKNNNEKKYVETEGLNKNNEKVPLEIVLNSPNSNEHIKMTVLLRDISKYKQTEESIRYRAYYDQLTALPNRSLFMDRAELALKQANRLKEFVGILFIDLDDFKKINDSFGHDAGDKYLIEISTRFVKFVRESDTVSRWGGDEFVVLLPRIKHAEDAVILAERILISNQRPIKIDKSKILPKTSIGISIYPGNGENLTTLIKNADSAMYHAKESGKNNYRLCKN